MGSAAPQGSAGAPNPPRECAPGPAPASSNGDGAITPDLARHVPNGMTVLAREDGDLDADGCPDVAIVLRAANEPPGHMDGDDDTIPRRALVVLRRRSDAALELAARNDRIVLCAGCGGTFGEPFSELEIKDGTLSIGFYGGASQRWSIGYAFRWDAAAKDWLLVEETSGEHDSMNPEATEQAKRRTPKEFGRVRLADVNRQAN